MSTLQDIVNGVTGLDDKPKPKQLLPDEWAALFIRALVKDRGYNDKYREISADDLVREAKRFANKWMSETGAVIQDSEIMDACFNMGWLLPQAENTWTIRDDLIERLVKK